MIWCLVVRLLFHLFFVIGTFINYIIKFPSSKTTNSRRLFFCFLLWKGNTVYGKFIRVPIKNTCRVSYLCHFGCKLFFFELYAPHISLDKQQNLLLFYNDFDAMQCIHNTHSLCSIRHRTKAANKQGTGFRSTYKHICIMYNT